ncbi:PREDICTED: dehydrogenase/reductase SDR family member 11-like, partial [Wasmannia auropunctata]|uniref:dehydrogenase/reductase SDR family member 11-like n=1 Tax=Wasmannia auropunctata TaxID=64793 RepID=UPI0005F00160
ITFADTERKTYEKLLDTNVLAVAVCTNLAVRSMRKRDDDGHIFTITSVESHSIMPIDVGMNVYGATKHASLALAHTVRLELAELKSRIRVTTISPSSVKTNKFDHSKAKGVSFKKTDFQPSDIADAIIYVLGTRPEVQITQLIIQPTGESIRDIYKDILRIARQ